MLEEVRAACEGPIAALPVPYRTTEDEPTFQSLTDPGCVPIPEGRPFPTALDPFICNRYELGAFTPAAHDLGVTTSVSAAGRRPTTSAASPRRWGAPRRPAASAPT